MNSVDNLINVGDYIVVQRQTFIKLHKLKAYGTISLGKDQVELENAIGKPYFSTFRMVTKPKNKRVYILELSTYADSVQTLGIDKSGVDNRDIIDDGQSQQLTTEEITKFRDDALSSSDIVSKLINNSKTFESKTEFSQEKYLKKKEKKYFEFIQVRRPSVRLINEIYYRQDPAKVLGIRLDDLSQILTYSNVQSDSNVLLYDSGTSGLMAASLISRIGANTTGVLVHMHPGNVCQKEAFLALKFPKEQSERCINVCLYSVLRCFYQEIDTTKSKCDDTNEPSTNNQLEISVKTNNQLETSVETNNQLESSGETNNQLEPGVEASEQTDVKLGLGEVQNKRKRNESEERPAKRPCWQYENEKACKILINKVDSLVIVAKEHPTNIVKELLNFLDNGRPIVIFSLLRESLETLYIELKNRTDIINLRLCSNMMRNYQVLPERTHPDVNMTCGGYVLTGFKISTKSDE